MCDHQISPMKKMKAIVETQRLSEDLEVPVFDMSPLLYSKDEKKISKLCESMGKAMAETSILIVRDPRVSKTDSGNFLDMMERYFSQERELLDKDVRAELQYVERSSYFHSQDHLTSLHSNKQLSSRCDPGKDGEGNLQYDPQI